MAHFTGSPAVVKQWKTMEAKELSFLQRQYEDGASEISDAVMSKVPEKFDATLKTMFAKAFALIFEKGTGVIEKTYRKNRHTEVFNRNAEKHEEVENKMTTGAFSLHSGLTRAKNVVIAGVEGLGFGAFGIALPDIPVFTALIMKSVYETALSYGYEYESDEERLFILKLIEASTLHGDELYAADKAINRWIHAGKAFPETLEEQIKRTSDALAISLLASKAVQNIPVAGMLGGTYNVIFINNVTTYADCKYKRRFLFTKLQKK